MKKLVVIVATLVLLLLVTAGNVCVKATVWPEAPNNHEPRALANSAAWQRGK